MQQSRGAVTGLYFCGALTAGLILALMAYLGVFDGLWNELFESVKDIAKYLLD
ncbi:MAG TPA: hypothetical protein VFA67_14155 [Candidatus Sulfotelmatobacter sp.]|nr:hypothetical protein [Candidatus Sulfotelmatobacter sp.]